MNTKKELFATISVAVAIAVSGCGGNPSNNNGVVANDSVSVSDSVAVVAVESTEPDTLAFDTLSYAIVNSKVNSSVALDYPMDNTPFAANVRQFINENLANFSLSYTQAYDSPRILKPFVGDLTAPDAMLKFYVKGNADYLESLSNNAEEEEEMQTNCNIMMRKIYEDSKYVTYNTTIDLYFGGAHGSFGSFGSVISKSSGKALKQTVDSTMVKQLQPLIREGVIQYFNENGFSDVNESNVFENLLLDGDSKEIPLPAHAPIFTAQGVAFTYQQYEIAPYSYGLVTFNVPFSQMKQFLVPEAKALLD